MSDASHVLPAVTLRQCALDTGGAESLFNLWNTLQEASVDAAVTDNPSVFHFEDRCLSFQTIHDPATLLEARPQLQPMVSPRKYDTRIEPYYVAPLHFNRRSLGAGPSSSTAPTETPFDGVENVWSDRNHVTEDVFSGNAGAQAFSSTLGLDDALTWRRERISSNINQGNWAISTEVPNSTSPDFIGIIYLLSLPHAPSELSLGLALIPSAQKKGFGTAAIIQVLKLAFDNLEFHRVSVAVLDGPGKEHTLRMFVRLGFTYEGTRRRAVMSPGTALWRDSHHLGMLDTDWVARGFRGKSIPRTRWDEMLARHQREQEALIGAEERSHSLKRTASTETLRPVQCDLAADSGAESADEVEVESSEGHSESERSVSPASAHNGRGDADAINPFLDANGHATPDPRRHNSPPDAYAYPEQASDPRSEHFTSDPIARGRTLRYSNNVFDPPSDDEHDALLPGFFHIDAYPDHRRQSLSPSEGTQQPPPESESEAEADISGDSESEADHYASSLESDGDELLLVSQRAHTHDRAVFASRSYYVGPTEPKEEEKRRLEDDEGVASSSLSLLSSSACEPTNTQSPDPSVPAPGQPTARPSNLQESKHSPPVSPHGVDSPRQRTAADDMESDSEAWDVVSNGNFSGFETDSSTSSSSLQSASDSGF